jgi:hypothetical protein
MFPFKRALIFQDPTRFFFLNTSSLGTPTFASLSLLVASPVSTQKWWISVQAKAAAMSQPEA